MTLARLLVGKLKRNLRLIAREREFDKNSNLADEQHHKCAAIDPDQLQYKFVLLKDWHDQEVPGSGASLLRFPKGALQMSVAKHAVLPSLAIAKPGASGPLRVE